MTLLKQLKEKLLVEFLNDRDKDLFEEIILSLKRQEKLLKESKAFVETVRGYCEDSECDKECDEWLTEFERMHK